MCSNWGCVTTVSTPPFSAPGVMEVTLSIKRCSASSVNLTLMSLPLEMTWSPFNDQVVLITQSLCDPICSTCFPVEASTARTVLSAQPNATNLLSGDQLTP